MERSLTDRRSVAVGFVLLTVILLVAGLAIVGLIARVLFARAFSYRDIDRAAFWNNEIVYAEHRVSNSFQDRVISKSGRIKALNPQTGRVRDLGVEVPSRVQGIVVVNGSLWIVCPKEVVQVEKATIKRYRPRFTLSHVYVDPSEPQEVWSTLSRDEFSIPFCLNDQLMGIARDPNGNHRIYSFENGEWQPGMRIATPPFGRMVAPAVEPWRVRFVPNEITPRKSTDSPTWNHESLRVEVIGDEVHVVCSNRVEIDRWGQPGGLAAEQLTYYRKGFDFVPEDDGESALAPSNDPPIPTGWIQFFNVHWKPLPCSVNGRIHLLETKQAVLRKPPTSKLEGVRDADVQLLDQTITSDIEISNVVSSADGKDSYLLVSTGQFALVVCRIIDGNIQKLPYSLPGEVELFLQFECIVLAMLFVVWLSTHLIVLRWMSRWLTRNSDDRFSCGHQTVRLASLWRRGIARGIDIGVLLLLPAVVAWWTLNVIPSHTNCDYQVQIASKLMDVVSGSSASPEWGFIWYLIFDEIKKRNLIPLWTIAFIWMIFFALATSVKQGQGGQTIGKRLLGLRVVRTTLKPCDPVYSLVRELMMSIDSLALLCPVPGMILILLTDTRQRLGDYVADTIVIDSNENAKVRLRL